MCKVMCIPQNSAHTCLKLQGGCGYVPNTVELWGYAQEVGVRCCGDAYPCDIRDMREPVGSWSKVDRQLEFSD